MTSDKDSALLADEVVPLIIQNPITSRELFRINADGSVVGEIEDASEAAKVFFESLRRFLPQPTQTDALAPVGTKGNYINKGFVLACRVTAHVEGWLEVEFKDEFKEYNSSGVIRPSRFAALEALKETT
jgi:hypothetical protein